MKEDILEQMVDEYLQHKGYFTRRVMIGSPSRPERGCGMRPRPDPESLFFVGVLLVRTPGLLTLARVGCVAHGCIATAAFGIGLLHLALLGRIAGVAGFHG